MFKYAVNDLTRLIHTWQHKSVKQTCLIIIIMNLFIKSIYIYAILGKDYLHFDQLIMWYIGGPV